MMRSGTMALALVAAIFLLGPACKDDAVCGNGIVEDGETCDGNCRADCDDGNPCTEDVASGSPYTCDFSCSNTPITQCIDGDLCCPAGCETTDRDCLCGNGVIDPGELCENDCPQTCDDGDPCTEDVMTGSPATCDAACTNTYRQGWHLAVVDSGSDAGWHSDIAVDAQGHPHISYAYGDEPYYELRYAYWDGEQWQQEVVDSDSWVGKGNSIALDSAGVPRISYTDFYYVDKLKYAIRNGGAWQTEFVHADAGTWDVGWNTSIAVDSNQRTHISYAAEFGTLLYVWWTGSQWERHTVDDARDSIWATALALDSANRPHIAYHFVEEQNSDTQLRLATLSGGSWQIETVDTGVVGYNASLVLDSAERPHIAYGDGENESLKYARWTGSSWQIETVDTSGAIGFVSSLALDSGDHPHIAYYDYNTKDLKHAYHTGGSWIISVIDSAGAVGNRPSVAVDALDHPHISYHDDDNGDLKYALFCE